MKKLQRSQQGIAHLALIIIGILVVVGLVGWRVMAASENQDDRTSDTQTNQQSGSQNQNTAQATNDTEADIQLQNLGVDLQDVDVTTQAVRDFKSQGLKGFYVFGDALSGGRINPNFEFASLKTGTKLVSSIDGIVAFIREQPDSKDFEVFIQPKEKSMWTIGYDHVTNVSVTKGAAIKAGDVIGEPAMQNNGLTRFEIQINKDENGATTHYCPTTLLAATVKDSLFEQLKEMQENWETTTSLELYDVAAQDPVGCIKKTMTPAEAEGKS